jgi:putative FmdB family regulatory protein
MPTYDYICDACGHEFETSEPITANPRTDCPVCKELKLRRKIGAGMAILFKGSGFYQTDYRSESYKKAAQAEKAASEPAKAGGESKSSESKPSESTGSTSSKSEPAKAGPAPKSET